MAELRVLERATVKLSHGAHYLRVPGLPPLGRRSSIHLTTGPWTGQPGRLVWIGKGVTSIRRAYTPQDRWLPGSGA